MITYKTVKGDTSCAGIKDIMANYKGMLKDM